MGEVTSVQLSGESTGPVDPANVSPEPTPEAQPAAPVEPQATPAPTPEARPDWLPQTFATGEDLARAYQELHAKMSREGAPKPEGETPAETTEQPPVPESLDLQPFQEEFEQFGRLSDESYAHLEARGVPRITVDNYIAGQVARQGQIVSGVYEQFGGAEQYAEATAWAEANMTPAETMAFNAAVDSGDPGRINMAVQNLRNRYQAAVGEDVVPITPQSNPSESGVTPFASTEAMVRAIQHPDYEIDPGYRAEVEARVRASKF